MPATIRACRQVLTESGIESGHSQPPQVRAGQLQRVYFTQDYKERILREVDSAGDATNVREILRRESLSPNYLCVWRRERKQAPTPSRHQDVCGGHDEPNRPRELDAEDVSMPSIARELRAILALLTAEIKPPAVTCLDRETREREVRPERAVGKPPSEALVQRSSSGRGQPECSTFMHASDEKRQRSADERSPTHFRP